MLPSFYICTACNEKLSFPFYQAYYYLGSNAMGQLVRDEDLLAIPVRPAWCKTCTSLCAAEDIASLRDFENACGAVRSGKPVEYPLETEHMDQDMAISKIQSYLRWRMSRRHKPRALCCGGHDFLYTDVEQPLFKHAGCDFGSMEPQYWLPGSHNWQGPGISSPADIRIYDAEGELLGQLTWHKREENKWDTEKLSYPRAVEE
ncbi:hypothetical protein [Undibacterium sp. Tian12W]|uniref:hypothetical protein n=1 Tax=Undibacterium sp. Tian12W TaxID=3413054 RepID=UPI003BF45BDF